MNVAFPYGFDTRGRTAGPVSDEQHIRDLLLQLLFTAPGERVNRPTFGTPLRQLVFEPNSPELAAATQQMVQSALQQWLGDVIKIEAVEVESRDERLEVLVRYVDVRTQQRRVERFAGKVP